MSDGDIFEHMVDHCGGDGLRRMDVVVSGGGRRSWAPDVKARIIAESLVPGVNVSEVARRNGMQPQHLYMWRRKALERMAEGQQDYREFVPVRIAETPMVTSASTSVIDEKCAGDIIAAQIGLELGGATLRIPGGASADHIVRVLQAVRAVS